MRANAVPLTSKLKRIFEDAIERHTFPGAVVWLARGDETLAHEAFGTTAYDAEYSRPVTLNTIYDIASLTKLFTATAFFITARENNIPVTAPLAQFLPEFGVLGKAEITLRQLLQHNSGIEIAIQSLTDTSPAEWIAQIAAAELHAKPGARVLYSCTNFFLLARVIEQLYGQPLDVFLNQRVLQPLGMSRTSYVPRESFPLDEIAPAEVVKGKCLHGVVHDEAARAWQEYSGHASTGNSGLFSTASDLAKYAQLWLHGGTFNGKKILEEADVQAAVNDTAPEESPQAKRGLGWQIDAHFYMSHLAPAGSAGHAGFTGPTLWLNRSTRHLAIILNNRVHPTRDSLSRFPVHRRAARWLLAAAPAD